MSLSAPKHTSYPSAPNIVPFNCFFEGPLIPDPQVWGQLTTHSKSTPKQKKTTSNKNSHSETKKHGAKPELLIKKERTKHSPLPFRCLAYKLVMQLIQFFWGSVKATWKTRGLASVGHWETSGCCCGCDFGRFSGSTNNKLNGRRVGRRKRLRILSVQIILEERWRETYCIYVRSD